MSTRATYHFPATRTTFYIHSDGYPDGAAGYLFRALVFEADMGFGGFEESYAKSAGGFADRFHRANHRAELTTSADDHGDLEYRYTVEPGELHREKGDPVLTVESVANDWSGKGEPALTVIYKGPLSAFLNLMGPDITTIDRDPGAEGAVTFEPVGFCNGRLMTRTIAHEIARKVRAEAEEYCRKFPHFTGNCNGQRADAESWEIAAATFTPAPAAAPLRIVD